MSAFLAQLKSQNVLVLGLGLTGLSCARFLSAQGIKFAVNDSRDESTGQNEVRQLSGLGSFVTGGWDQTLIGQADCILVSPGLDTDAMALDTMVKSTALVIGDVELFCRVSDLPVLAVTGSNGKSTVVSLLGHIATSLGLRAAVAGNIGVPVLDMYASPLDCLILELSSFQLETMCSLKAEAAVVLNVSDDHLDRHKTFAAYSDIKHRIYEMAKLAVVNLDRDAATKIPKDKPLICYHSQRPSVGQFGLLESKDDIWLMYGDQALLAASSLRLAGKHNLSNCLAALALGHAMSWSLTDMAKALTTFNGLDHRCQRVDTQDGIIWINDSKATNVGATLAAIEGLQASARRLILIAGGDGKGADFSPLQPVFERVVDHVITIGKDGAVLAALASHATPASSMADAVAKAKLMAKPGDTVLLSPACASLDMFKNYIDRGNQFADCVRDKGAVCN